MYIYIYIYIYIYNTDTYNVPVQREEEAVPGGAQEGVLRASPLVHVLPHVPVLNVSHIYVCVYIYMYIYIYICIHIYIYIYIYTHIYNTYIRIYTVKMDPAAINSKTNHHTSTSHCIMFVSCVSKTGPLLAAPQVSLYLTLHAIGGSPKERCVRSPSLLCVYNMCIYIYI